MTTMTTTTRELTTRTGRTVQTPYTADDAHERLRDLVALGEIQLDFPRDLAAKQLRWLSREQIIWVHIIVVETDQRLAAPAPVAHHPLSLAMPDAPTFDLSETRDRLRHAAEHGIKFPKIRLAVDDQSSVLLKYSTRTGEVNITDGGAYGADVWYGRIDIEGQFAASPALLARPDRDAIESKLRAFNAAPAVEALVQGALTSRCCFCRKELTTKESVGAGYGPICAGNYGLPWGEETAAKYDDKKAAIVGADQNSNEMPF